MVYVNTTDGFGSSCRCSQRGSLIWHERNHEIKKIRILKPNKTHSLK
ncbi:hypothetical protein T11_9412 [Trichinella zimbabwensis]|uniref:Uncharacterized protein n=1 Tax=Trichinella zimbabwensis TaxID=268475 RepID=A0A0V1GKI6_9BILA|nr:hypothetical protein T11_9412 [Trichinella zimbabwensis]